MASSIGARRSFEFAFAIDAATAVTRAISSLVTRGLAAKPQVPEWRTRTPKPKFSLSIRQNFLPNVKTFYYMRLHGRNVAQWWHHEKSEDRYNYLYASKELQEFADIAGAAQALVKKSYLYTNNHFASKSVVNAVMLKSQLGQPIDGEYPPALVERYPEIKDVVSVGRPRSAVVIPARLPVE